MAPKGKPAEEAKEEEKGSEPPPRSTTVWVYGINDHLVGPPELPGIEYGRTLRGDYQRVCKAVNAIAHPALKLRPRPPKPERRGSKPQQPDHGLVNMGRRRSLNGLEGMPNMGRRGSRAGMDLAAAAAAMANMGRRGSRVGLGNLSGELGKADWGSRESAAEPPPPLPKDPEAFAVCPKCKKEYVDPEPANDVCPVCNLKCNREPPFLKVNSMLLDGITMHLLALLLPKHSYQLKVLCFSDCRLDVEMLEMLHRGLERPCNIEALQIEWNPLDLPLPSPAEMDVMDKVEEAAAAEDGETPGVGAGGPPENEEAGVLGDSHDLEVRERRRYLLQSHRTLRSFKEWLLQIYDGDLEAAWKVLEERGDAATPLHSGDFQDTLEARLGTSGSQVLLVFEALDGPDYGGSEGRVSLAALRRTLENLPEEPAREPAEDPIGAALAPFVGSECILDSVSLRACGLTRLEMGAMALSLQKASWQLRILNLWDNYLCSRAMEPLAAAFEDFRGLEYLGLARNRISDKGLATICTPFNIKFLDEAGVKAAQDQIKQQTAQRDAAEKAKAKAKPKPPAEPGERVFREMPLLIDELKECPAEEEGGETMWVLRRPCELKTLNLSENPIKDARALEGLQPWGPEGAELILRNTPLSSTMPQMMTKQFGLGNKGRRASGVASEGWVLRML